MANTDNQCSKLQIEDFWSSRLEAISPDTLGDILNLQVDTQQNVYGYNFKNMNNHTII